LGYERSAIALAGKPVVSSNQASICAAYRAIGLTPKITGFGRRLGSLA